MDSQLIRPPKAPAWGNTFHRIFSANIISRRLSPFSLFANGEMSEGQRGGTLKFFFGDLSINMGRLQITLFYLPLIYEELKFSL